MIASNRTNSNFLLLAVIPLLWLPAHGLDISGKVIDKRWAPIPGARVCPLSDANACATTAADGTFHFTGTVGGLRSVSAPQAFHFGYAGGRLAVMAPAAASMRLQWFTAGGKIPFTAADIRLAPGANSVVVPAAMPAGMIFWRLSAHVAGQEASRTQPLNAAAGHERIAAAGLLTWRGVWDGAQWLGSAPVVSAVAAGDRPGIGKTGAVRAIAALIVSKSGYASATYQPQADPETDDLIVLGGVGEKVSLLFNGKDLDGWLQSSGKELGNAAGTWEVREHALHANGTVRGTLASKRDYASFRLILSVRQLPSTGTDNHYASALIWGIRPPPNDALGALQFGLPNGYHWDYRPGKPGDGGTLFKATSAGLSRTAWSQCEILAKAATGEARMACCQLTGDAPCKAKEVLSFKDASAGRAGPVALQIHSVGGHDEYKNITLEENPADDSLITTK